MPCARSCARTRRSLRRRLDDRDLVIFAAREFGVSIRSIAEILRVSRETVRDAIARFEGFPTDPPGDFAKSLHPEPLDWILEDS